MTTRSYEITQSQLTEAWNILKSFRKEPEKALNDWSLLLEDLEYEEIDYGDC